MKRSRTVEDLAAQYESQNQTIQKLQNILSKKNYESSYPAPAVLREHFSRNQKSFNIQFLGCRGSGKSSLINKIIRSLKIRERSVCGVVETTKETTFFDITQKIKTFPAGYDQVFLVDQPGIGGSKVTEAEYLEKFGPGRFQKSILCKEQF